MSKQSIDQIIKLSALHATVLLLVVLAVMATRSSDADNQSATQEQKHTYSFDLDGRDLVLHNLAGRIEIHSSDSDEAKIEATIVAGGDDAQKHLALVEIEPVENSKGVEIFTHYPVDEYTHYFYQAGRGFGETNTTLRYQNKKVRVSNRSGRSALDVHVDYVVRLPRGASFVLTHAVGSIEARNVVADLNLDNHSGPVTVSNSQGKVVLDTGSGQLELTAHHGDAVLDTGSGNVTVSDLEGRLSADTGSGNVKITRVTGEVNADTGSGDVRIREVTGHITADTGSGSINMTGVSGDVSADTGSGGVTLDTVSGSILVDTGSGSIDVTNWRGGKTLDVDTGSGSIEVDGDFSSVRKVRADTSSGSVKLVTSTEPSLRLEVEGGSSIDIDLPNMVDIRKGRHRFSATIGGGEGRAVIGTSSGSVRFTQR